MKVTIELNPNIDIDDICFALNYYAYDDEVVARHELLEAFDESEDEEDFKRTLYCWISEARDSFDEDFNTAFYWSEEYRDKVIADVINYLKDGREDIEKDYREYCGEED